jgi:hypothetical protein
MAMKKASNVEHFYVVEDIGASLVAGSIDLLSGGRGWKFESSHPDQFSSSKHRDRALPGIGSRHRNYLGAPSAWEADL